MFLALGSLNRFLMLGLSAAGTVTIDPALAVGRRDIFNGLRGDC